MRSAEDIAASLNARLPVGAFDDIAKGTPSWATEALEDAWTTVMGRDDAVKFARQHVEPVLREAASSLADVVKENGGQLAGVIGPAVALAVPVVGAIAAGIAYLAQAIGAISKSVEAQRDIMREGKRIAIVAQAVGFKAGALHAFAGPWKGSDCNSWRTPFSCRSYSFWLPPPAYSPILEITPALFPSWNPYKAPGPHKQPGAAKPDVPLNDILLAAQVESLTDPWVIARTPIATLDAMARKASAARSGQDIRFSNGNRRRLEDGEAELWRACIGNVAAARAAMMREAPQLLAAASLREYGPPNARRLEVDRAVSPDIAEVVKGRLPSGVVIPDGLGWSGGGAGAIGDAFGNRGTAAAAVGLALAGVLFIAASRGTR